MQKIWKKIRSELDGCYGDTSSQGSEKKEKKAFFIF
jgi:hypothetical protein